MTEPEGIGPAAALPGSGAGLNPQMLLYQGALTRIYRAGTADGRTVVVKLPRDPADPAAAASLQHELEIARGIRSEHVVEALGIEQGGDHVALLLEDFGGRSLDRILAERRLPLAEALAVGVQAADALAAIHGAGVIHKDINPSNIVYNEATGVAKVIDFGIATCLPREHIGLESPAALEGTLPYLSPEQTGRMNRSVDYRTDFYSLGATLYELLGHRRLLETNEPIEWLHCHIAREPLPLHRIDRQIPAVVSEIVAKLLAKSADERYRSAAGIRADLGRCLEEWRHRGAVHPFPIGSKDRPERFQLPQRLYGRDREIERLLASFDRVSHGAAELVLVAGYSGIGKSSLIRELFWPITRRGGAFVSGKFDQLHRGVPLSAPVSALRDLVRQLLTEPESALSGWRPRLLEAVSGNGGLITELIPELETVIGPQAAPEPLPPAAAERRFQRTMIRFIGAFCDARHPLVVFLDDLQWADPASLAMLELMLVEGVPGHMLVIGAYRDNEVHAGHPLALAVTRMRAAAAVDELTLAPLERDDLAGLLADALYTDREHVAGLTELVLRKAGGNPHFTGEFLKDLYRRNLVAYDADANAWTWDDDGIANEPLTDNMAELMSDRLARLSRGTRELLQVAACFGHRFELGLLLAVRGNDWTRLYPALREAIGQGLIEPAGNRTLHLGANREPGPAERAAVLRFTHDRIQQAAHELRDAGAPTAIHLEIGRVLISDFAPGASEQHLFRITDHLNAARPLIRAPAERRELAGWNRAAAQRASAAAAWDAAYQYFTAAIELRGEGTWQAELHEMLALYADAADAACMTARYEACDGLLATALARAPDHISAAPLNRIRLASLSARGLHTQALELGKRLMADFGVRFPERPRRLSIYWEFLRTTRRLRRQPLSELLEAPVHRKAAVDGLYGLNHQLVVAAHLAQPDLLALIVLRGVEQALRHGITEHSIRSFSGLGVQLVVNLGRVAEGLEYSRFAMALCDRFPGSSARGKVHLNHHAFVAPWIHPLRDLLEPLARAYELCVADNDPESAAQAVTYRLSYALAAGLPLPTVENEIRTWRAAVSALGQHEAATFIDAEHQMVLNLLGDTEDPTRLTGSSYDIHASLPAHEAISAKRLVLSARVRQAILLYTFDRPEEALVHMDAVAALAPSTRPVIDGLALHCSDALIRLALAGRRRGRERRRLLRQAARDRRVVARWAAAVPANAQSQWHLLEAEWFRVRGDERRAQHHYDRAIEAARAHRLPMEEASANRRAALMHLDAGRPTIAGAYLAEARRAYQRWGADAVVRHLEERYSTLLPQAGLPPPGAGSPGRSGAMAGVDLTALMKALRALAEERVYSRMMRIIIDTAMAFAGAQHGLLMLRDDRQRMRIEAEASVDRGDAQILQSIPVESNEALSHAVVNYVMRTRTSVVVHDAQEPGGPVPGLHLDRHVQRERVCSILCLPILSSGDETSAADGSASGASEVIGLLYLENNRASHTFTEERLETLEIIGMSVAGRLELSRKAAVDGLTGLFNRDYFQTMLRQEIRTSQRHQRSLSLILADIDHFKRFNDTWGHQAGDDVLRQVAAALQSSCREADIAARFGGEELAIILPDTDAAGAHALAERIRVAIEALRVAHGDEALSVTVSLGVATLAPQMPDEHALLRAADEALYDAKHAGRNRVRVA